jgi:RND family efflux transporter MFP subunit
MRNKLLSPGTRYRLATAALLFAVGAAAPSCASADEQTVQVQTVPARHASIDQTVRAYGAISTGSTSIMTIALPYSARVARLHVAPGQIVERGVPLFDAAPDPAAVLAAQQADSAVGVARRELQRMQSMYDAQLATASQLDASRKGLGDAQFALQAQQRLGATTALATVKAPATGTVLEITATQGEQVAAGTAIMHVARSDGDAAGAANVALSVEPADVAGLRAGDIVTIRSLNASLKVAGVQGKLVTVGAAINAQTQLVDVWAAVPINATGLLAGMKVAADIVANSGTHWIVPRSAVLRDDGGSYVFQVDSGGKAHRVNVAEAAESGDEYGVDGDLSAALPVVSSGNYELSDGVTVQSGKQVHGSAQE